MLKYLNNFNNKNNDYDNGGNDNDNNDRIRDRNARNRLIFIVIEFRNIFKRVILASFPYFLVGKLNQVFAYMVV